MTRLRLYIIVLAATLAGSLPGRVLANDRDLRATPVPASSCEPYFAQNVGGPGSEPWYNGYFGIEGVQFGQDHRLLYLHCPLSVNNMELSNPKSNDNDRSSFQVTYRDADGLGTATWVEVYLYQTVILASGEAQNRLICQWSSLTNGTSATGFTRVNVPCVHDIPPGAFYTFEPRLLTRFLGVSPSPVAAFAGITFP